MKIDFNPKPVVPANTQSQNIDPAKKQKAFGQIMAETMSTAKPSPGNQSRPTSVASMDSLALKLMGGENGNSNVMSKTEQLLDILDQYRANLADPSVSLRKMEPLTHKMSIKLKELESELEQLHPGDPFVSILKEATTTAAVEVQKFASGWYNPA